MENIKTEAGLVELIKHRQYLIVTMLNWNDEFGISYENLEKQLEKVDNFINNYLDK